MLNLALVFAASTQDLGQAAPPKYRLEFVKPFNPGATPSTQFRIEGPQGVVKKFSPVGGALMHLIVFTKDKSKMQEYIPAMALDGTWSTLVQIPSDVPFHVFAQFKPVGGVATLAKQDVSPQGVMSNHHRIRWTENLGPASGRAVRARAEIPSPLLAGRSGLVTFQIQNLMTGEDKGGIQPFGGSWGRLVMASDSSDDLVTASSADPLKNSGPSKTGMVSFQVAPQTRGIYHAFLEVMEGGRLDTIHFVFNVG